MIRCFCLSLWKGVLLIQPTLTEPRIQDSESSGLLVCMWPLDSVWWEESWIYWSWGSRSCCYGLCCSKWLEGRNGDKVVSETYTLKA